VTHYERRLDVFTPPGRLSSLQKEARMGFRVYTKVGDNTYLSQRIWAGMFGLVAYFGLSILGLIGIVALLYSLT